MTLPKQAKVSSEEVWSRAPCFLFGLLLGVLFGFPFFFLDLPLIVVMLLESRSRLLKQRLLLGHIQKPCRRLIVGLLPARDHLARAWIEGAVVAVRVEAERG